MNIETKEQHYFDEKAKNRQIALMAKFGWQYTQDVKRSRGSHYAVFARDKDMPNYRLIAALDDKYFSLERRKKTYSPITDSPENFLLILLLVIPFLLYLAYKTAQKKRIRSHNAAIESQQEAILKEVATLL